MTFKIATWNINSIKMRLEHLTNFVQEHDPDIICLQELKCETDKFPHEELSHLPYNFYINGQKSYNGVAIFSKMQADEVQTNFANNPLPDEARFIECSFDSPIGYIKVISLYAPNGGEVNSSKFENKLKFYDQFNKYLQQTSQLNDKLFVGSDYNIAPFDLDVYDADKLRQSTCFTYKEQEKLRALLNNGFVDNYRLCHPNAQEYSWWDYRAGAFQQNKGMRIDSIISTYAAAEHLVDCKIDYNMRTQSKPSDHSAVLGYYKIHSSKNT